MSWTFGLAELDFAGGAPIGKIEDALDRKLSLRLNGNPSAGCTMRIDNPMAQKILDREGDCLLKAYDASGTLRFVGDLMTIEQAGDSSGQETVAITAAGPQWRLQKRVMDYPAAAWPYSSPTQAQLIISGILSDLNSYQATGVSIGSTDALYETTVGTEPPGWAFKPFAEGIADMQEAEVPYPIGIFSYLTAFDRFEAARTPNSNLAGYGDELGNTWQGHGAAGSGAIIWTNAPNSAARVSGSDAGSDLTAGYWVTLGINLASCVAQFTTSVSAAASGATGNVGGVARVNTGTNSRVVFAYTAITNRVDVAGIVSGSIVWQDTITLGAGIGNDIGYTMRFKCDDAGNYQLWLAQTDLYSTDVEQNLDTSGPIMAAQHSELATGGSLASGDCGIFDLNTSSPYFRFWDNFYAQPYGPPQSFDYQFNPVEPTGGGIATLDIKQTIGTDKSASVIFEWGRNMASYRRILNRENLVNQAFSLDPNFPDPFTFREYRNNAAVTARGLYQEVIPSDVTSSVGRQALMQAEVGLRYRAQLTTTFEPADLANLPVFGTDYVLGDWVTARAPGPSNTTRFSDPVRVYGIDVSIDENELVSTIPQLVRE